MKQQFIRFIDKNIDGCGTDVTVLASVRGDDITLETINRIKDSICNYKNENKECDTDDCLAVAQHQLEAEGYKIQWIDPVEICF